MVLPGGVGHPAPFLEVHDVGLDLVGPYTKIGRVDGVLAADAEGEPALEELELLSVVVHRLLAPASRALGREEEVDRVPEPEPIIPHLGFDRYLGQGLARLNVLHRPVSPRLRFQNLIPIILRIQGGVFRLGKRVMVIGTRDGTFSV